MRVLCLTYAMVPHQEEKKDETMFAFFANRPGTKDMDFHRQDRTKRKTRGSPASTVRDLSKENTASELFVKTQGMRFNMSKRQERNTLALQGEMGCSGVRGKKREETIAVDPVALGILEDLRQNARSSGRFRFFQKVPYMLFNRVFAYSQMSGNFFIGPTLTDIFHNFHFPIR